MRIGRRDCADTLYFYVILGTSPCIKDQNMLNALNAFFWRFPATMSAFDPSSCRTRQLELYNYRRQERMVGSHEIIGVQSSTDVKVLTSMTRLATRSSLSWLREGYFGTSDALSPVSNGFSESRVPLSMWYLNTILRLQSESFSVPISGLFKDHSL